MRGFGKKLRCQESDKPYLSKGEKESKLNASLQTNNGSKMQYKRKHKSKSKSHPKLVGSTLLERTVSSSLGKGNLSDSMNRRYINKTTLCRTLGAKFSKKQSSLKSQGEKSSVICSEGNGEKANGDSETENIKKRRKRKRQKDNVQLDETSRLQRRSRYLLIKMKLEQNLIDAYLGEGWKGQSREKIKPEKELQRAKMQILKCKLGIRDVIHQLDLLSSVGSIEDSVMAPDGSVYHEHIFCAKCKLREAFPDNDIILCDGTCNCAFHQKCLDPPLATENIPPGDQGWLCKFCECKMEILEATNAHLGTHFSVNSHWQDIFKEEASLPDGGNALLNDEDVWPSDDSEDDDYDPARNESSCSCSKVGTDDNASDESSSYSSLSWSLEDEIFSGSGSLVKGYKGSKNSSVDSISGGDSDNVCDHEVINGRRQRRAVDYKKLYDEMFGKDTLANEQVSEDEDWGPAKRKRREKESDAVSTLMTLYESETKCPNLETMKNNHLGDQQIKKRFLRIPPSAVEKLRLAFAENELPSRAVKENLSRQLGLEPEKVNKWFKNARYIALKTRKAERGKYHHGAGPKVLKDPRSGKNTTDLEGKKDGPSVTLAYTLKNLRKNRQRWNHKSLASSLIKKQRKGASLGSPVNGSKKVGVGNLLPSASTKGKRPKKCSSEDQVGMEFGDDVSLKNQLKHLKEKIRKEKKSLKFKSWGVQEAEKEMERLCNIKSRIDQLKQVLQRLQNDTTEKSDKLPVIYVPIAELREKV